MVKTVVDVQCVVDLVNVAAEASVVVAVEDSEEVLDEHYQTNEEVAEVAVVVVAVMVDLDHAVVAVVVVSAIVVVVDNKMAVLVQVVEWADKEVVVVVFRWAVVNNNHIIKVKVA